MEEEAKEEEERGGGGGGKRRRRRRRRRKEEEEEEEEEGSRVIEVSNINITVIMLSKVQTFRQFTECSYIKQK